MLLYKKTNICGDYMKMNDINPHIRYAELNLFKSKPETVRVMDCRIFSTLSGEADIFIENQHYTLRENSFFYCCSGSSYTIGSECGASIFTLNFDLTQVRSDITMPYLPVKQSEAAFSSITNCDIVDDCSLLNSHIYIQNGSIFQSAVKNIIQEFLSKRIYFREKSSAALKDLLIDIYRKQPEKSDNSSEAVNKAITHIKANFNRKLSNSELAALVGYHEYHLNRLFLRHTGTSMHKYILQIRLDEAKRLILNTDIPLNIIADETGFGSNTHFTSYFKQAFGISPSEYRAKFKNSI